MSLKELIKNQKIIIDDHKRGAKEIKDWDNPSNDIHIDKLTNFPVEGRRQNVRIRVPINSERPIRINSGNRQIDGVPRKLEREIKKAFSDDKIRASFIGDLIEVLRDYESNLSNEQMAREALSNLSKHFNLEWTGEKISNYLNDVLKNYTEVYLDSAGREFFLKLNEESIEIGENSGYPKQFRKINRR